MKSRISPEENFPEDLDRETDDGVEILNSRVHREIEHEYATDGEVDPETDFRQDELREELDERDVAPSLELVREDPAS